MLRKITYIFVMLLCSLCAFASDVLDPSPSEDACTSGEHYYALWVDTITGEVKRVFMPEEYFTEEGALVPEWPTEENVVVQYMFRDYLVCTTENFAVEFEVEFLDYGIFNNFEAVLYYTPQPSLDLSFLDELRSAQPDERVEEKVSLSVTPNHSPLRAGARTSTMKFVYRNGIVYKYHDGFLDGMGFSKMCHIGRLGVEIKHGRAAVKRIEFHDYTRGTEMVQTFTDCSNMPLYPICEELEKPYLEASYDLPTCEDPVLRLHANTDLENVTWLTHGMATVGRGPELEIPYSEATSGTYIVYGQRDRCSEIIHDRLEITLPDIDSKTFKSRDSICEGESLTFRDTILTTSGHYTRVEPNELGCNDLYIEDLVVVPTDVHIYKTICSTNRYFFAGSYRNKTNTYRTTAKNKLGCDSLTTLHLTVEEYQGINYVDSTICYGDTILINGRKVFKNTDIQVDYPTGGVCDSTVEYHVRVRPLDLVTHEPIYVCEGKTIDVSGLQVARDTLLSDTTINEYGCKHFEITPVVQLRRSTKAITMEVCDRGDITLPSGKVVPDVGTYEDTLTNAVGCDSILTITITRHLEEKDSLLAICTEALPISVGGLTIADGGEYDYWTQGGECDTLVHLTVELRARQRHVLPDIHICSKLDPLPMDEEQTTEERDDFGCVVDVVQATKYHSIKYTDQTITLCYGETLTVGEHTYTQSGTYTDIIPQLLEPCDSIITTTLLIKPRQEIEEDSAFVCDDAKAGTIETDETESLGADGCPLFTLSPRRYLSNAYAEIDTALCTGITFEKESISTTTDGSYTFYYAHQAANGCDSTLIINVSFAPPIQSSRSVTLCYGDSLVTPLGTYQHAGSYTETYTNAFGCDSIVSISVSVRDEQRIDHSSVRICQGTAVTLSGVIYTDEATHIDTLTASNGCPEYHVTQILADEPLDLHDQQFEVCYGHRSEVSLSDAPEDAQYTWIPATYITDPRSWHTAAVALRDIEYTVAARRGLCRDTIHVRLHVNQPPQITSASLNAEQREISIEAKDGTEPFTYLSRKADYEGLESTIKVGRVGVYDVSVRDANGCSDSTWVHYVPPIKPDKFFDPTSEGRHSRWQIEGLEMYDHYRVDIYDRWGKLLLRKVDNFVGWDGTYCGHRMPSTDYWYTITVDQGAYDISGHFTLIREFCVGLP